MYESDVEKNVCRRYKDRGGIALKLVSPGFTGVGDRLGLDRIINKRHQEIVAKYVRFIELKKPGEKRKKRQVRVAEQMREKGYKTDVVDNLN